MLEQLAVRLNDYPTYVIPVETLRGANLLSGTVDQFVWKVHTVLDGYRSMNEAAFADFFSTVDDIKRSLAKTAAEIHGQAERATREFERLGGVGRRGG